MCENNRNYRYSSLKKKFWDQTCMFVVFPYNLSTHKIKFWPYSILNGTVSLYIFYDWYTIQCDRNSLIRFTLLFPLETYTQFRSTAYPYCYPSLRMTVPPSTQNIFFPIKHKICIPKERKKNYLIRTFSLISLQSDLVLLA